MPETVILTPAAVTRGDIDRVLAGRPARLAAEAFPRIEAAAAIIAGAAEGEAAVYGVNTGFGKLASRRIRPADTATLQRNLILSHCCGVGDPTPERVVRLMMALKLASLGRGASGVRPETVRLIEGMLARGVTPVVPAQGSVGASGDLAPLAHMAAAMIGEGEAMAGGRVMPARAALAAVGLAPVELGPKEGLALINGTQFSAAYALEGALTAERLALSALVTGALSVDAAMASTTPFRPEIQTLRGHAGQIEAARALMALLAGSTIREAHLDGDERVQDPYCLRCQPQVMGAALDLIGQALATLLVEANAATDNPLVLVETGEIVSGGNFHAEPVAFAADQVAIAISEIGAIAERRIATLVDPALNFGLPPFLTPAPGLNSGFMIAEVTAAALFAENKQRATPCSIDSTPTSANQEDHVSMAAHGARRLGEMNRNLAQIVGIELLVAAQGIDLRKRGHGLEALKGPAKGSVTLAPSLPSGEGDRPAADRVGSDRSPASATPPDALRAPPSPEGREGAGIGVMASAVTAAIGSLTTSPSLERVIAALRAEVPMLEGDRHMAADLATAARMVLDGEVLRAAGMP